MDNGGNADNNGWNTEDDLEIDNFVLSSSSSSGLGLAGDETTAGSGEVNSSTGSSSNSRTVDHFVAMGFSLEMVTRAIEENGEGNVDLILQSLLQESASSSAGPSCSKSSKLVDHFIGMGFSEKMVLKAIQENGEGNTDLILETLLTYMAIEKSPQADHVDSDHFSPEIDESFLEDFSDFDSISDTEDIANLDSNEGSRLLVLKRMGYTKDEASIAIQRCGPESSIVELTDFICAAQLSKTADALLPPEEKPKLKRLSNDYHKNKKSRISGYNQMKQDRRLMNGDDDVLHLPNPMIGFGVPSDPDIITHRTLPEGAIGPPYFYYENVALAPKGVWQTISRFLFDVEPEFVDSKYFCAAARKRGYVHNLPIENRFPLVPPPPITVHQAFPLTKKWWPSWDNRTKMNCLQTVTASAKLTDRIRKALEEYPDGDPPKSVQRWVLDECRKWNLVWVGRNKVAPLEPDEVEMLLGFPRNHTRGGGSSRTERYKSLGNSFQVDTVAYHLSVLKDMYPRGINMLSLFSGIGGAEVALHRLGITMKNVVSVEISEVNRNVVRGWWDQTQKGKLIHINDVQELNADRLEKLMNDFGGFDLVVGGSPCNNLAGSNRVHRTGLEGKESSLFFDYCRILDLVRCIMGRA